jgi:hypothetical protein
MTSILSNDTIGFPVAIASVISSYINPRATVMAINNELARPVEIQCFDCGCPVWSAASISGDRCADCIQLHLGIVRQAARKYRARHPVPHKL